MVFLALEFIGSWVELGFSVGNGGFEKSVCRSGSNS